MPQQTGSEYLMVYENLEIFTSKHFSAKQMQHILMMVNNSNDEISSAQVPLVGRAKASYTTYNVMIIKQNKQNLRNFREFKQDLYEKMPKEDKYAIWGLRRQNIR